MASIWIIGIIFQDLQSGSTNCHFYSTKAMSSITAYAEAAVLDPGHAKQIGKGNKGQIYVDDFEGTRSSIDLRFPLVSWTLASIPQGNNLFPESDFQQRPPEWI